MTSKSAANVLRKAESGLAKLATDAATERGYDLAEELLRVARTLAAMADKLEGSPAHPQGNGAAPSVASAPARSEDGDDEALDAPVFARHEDFLIKTAKSRGDGNSYEHKAPRSAVDALLASISEKATKKGEFKTGRVFPLIDATGEKMPSYQGYLALRWLRQIGLIQRVGRQRYLMAPGRDPVSSVEAAWESLQQR